MIPGCSRRNLTTATAPVLIRVLFLFSFDFLGIFAVVAFSVMVDGEIE